MNPHRRCVRNSRACFSPIRCVSVKTVRSLGKKHRPEQPFIIRNGKGNSVIDGMISHDNIFARVFNNKPRARNPARSFGFRPQRASSVVDIPKMVLRQTHFLFSRHRWLKKSFSDHYEDVIKSLNLMAVIRRPRWVRRDNQVIDFI